MPQPSACARCGRRVREAREAEHHVGRRVAVHAEQLAHRVAPSIPRRAGGALEAHQVARVAGLVEHAAHAPHARAGSCSARQIDQVGQPRMDVDAVRLLVELEARLERDQARLVVGAHRRVVGRRFTPGEHRLGGVDAGLQRLADALAGERIGAARGLAGDEQAGRARSARLRACSAAARPSARRAALPAGSSARAPAHRPR